ncbi:MAG: hypothetical protein ACYC7D_13265 [Nitrososphaerales archaeon]
MSSSDAALLAELGFKRSQTVAQREKIVADLNMRQLDRLKMMFKRIERKTPESFPERVKKGILLNQARSFAAAVEALL